MSKVVLVAPWVDPEKENKYDFFRDFVIDPEFTQRTSETVLFTSDNDFEYCKESARIISKTSSDVRVVTFKGYGHFIPLHMNSSEFPELMEEILK